MRHLQKIHEMYNRPLGLTEFAVVDWTAKMFNEDRIDGSTAWRVLPGISLRLTTSIFRQLLSLSSLVYTPAGVIPISENRFTHV